MSTPRFDSILEQQLAKALSDRGLVVVKEFRVPGCKTVFDFLLPQPPFGVIEVVGPMVTESPWLEKLKRVASQVELVRKELGQSARFYLAVVESQSNQGLSPDILPSGVVQFVGNIAKVAAQIVDDFHAHSIHLDTSTLPPKLPYGHSEVTVRERSKVYWAEGLATGVAESDELSRTLNTLVSNLDHLFLAAGRRILEHEYLRLKEEISHCHYTAAALRVGRSAEFIVYAACKSWDVLVNQPLLVCLKELDDRFNQLKSSLFNYADTNGEKDRSKKQLMTNVNDLQKKLLEIVSDLDDSVATLPPDDPIPINTGALLTDIRKRYKRISVVREEIDNARSPLMELLQRRNDAAHASLGNEPREISREQLSLMIDRLNVFLLHLSKCGTAIETYRRENQNS